MPSRKDLSDIEKCKILAFQEEKLSSQELSRGVSRSELQIS